VVEAGGKGAGIDEGAGAGDGLISATVPEGVTVVGEGKAEVVGTFGLTITALPLYR